MAMDVIRREFTALGYTVLFVPETATELIMGGVAPWTCGSVREYQWLLLQLQMKKEEIFEAAARTMKGDKFLLVCDRGALDCRAYMSEADFDQILAEYRLSCEDLQNRYHAVFHLVTAAKGAEDFYTTANNSARTETPCQARELDDKAMGAWQGHPHLRIIDNSTDFEGKMRRLIEDIASFLEASEVHIR